MGAPEIKSSLFIRCFSSNFIPSAGKVSKEDAPPEIRNTT